MDYVDAAKDTPAGDGAVGAEVVDVHLVHFELFEGLPDS